LLSLQIRRKGSVSNTLARRDIYEQSGWFTLANLLAGDFSQRRSFLFPPGRFVRRRDNSLGGVDWIWRTSSLGGDKNFSVGGWAAASRGDTPEGNRSGWGFKVDYPNDLWDVFAIVKKFGSGLDPALDCLPRPGTIWYQTGFSYQPRPQGGTFGWVRQFKFEFYPRLIQDEHGRTQSWRIFTAPFNARTRNGEHIEANIMPEFERLDEDFEIAEGVIIPAGDYNWTRYRVEGSTSNLRAWQLGTSVWFGDFYSGSMTQVEAFATYTTPAGHLQLELHVERDIGKLPEGDFKRFMRSPRISSCPATSSTTPNPATWVPTPACAGRSGCELVIHPMLHLVATPFI